MRAEVEAFREHLSREEKSDSTIRSYCYAVGRFFSEYGELTHDNAKAFKADQRNNYAPKTAANRVTALNCYCDFMKRHDCRVKTVPVQSRPTVENVITVEQYWQLLDGLESDGNMRGYWMVKFLAQTGSRASEFVRLNKSGLRTGTCNLYTKGKLRYIRIPDMLIRESEGYFENVEGDLLFPNRFGKQMTTRGISKNIVRWGIKYGLPKEVAHPHAFRHFFALEFLKVNNDVVLLKSLMGHNSVDTTAIYLKRSEEQERAEFNETLERMRTTSRQRPGIRLASGRQ